MVRASKWSLGLVSVVVVGLLSAGANSLPAQDAGKGDPSKKTVGQDRQEQRKARMEKFVQSVNGAKTTLSAAITTVEGATKAKVFRAAYVDTKDNKFMISIGVILNDKMAEVSVDPETGKAGEPKFEEEGRGAGPGAGRGAGKGKGGEKEGDGN